MLKSKEKTYINASYVGKPLLLWLCCRPWAPRISLSAVKSNKYVQQETMISTKIRIGWKNWFEDNILLTTAIAKDGKILLLTFLFQLLCSQVHKPTSFQWCIYKCTDQIWYIDALNLEALRCMLFALHWQHVCVCCLLIFEIMRQGVG